MLSLPECGPKLTKAKGAPRFDVFVRKADASKRVLTNAQSGPLHMLSICKVQTGGDTRQEGATPEVL